MIWGQRIQDTVGEFGIAIRSGLENPDYRSAGTFQLFGVDFGNQDWIRHSS